MFLGRHSYFSFTYDNWGANPSATPGTSVTPGATNAQGSWTSIATGSNIAQDCYGIYLQFMGGAVSAASKPQLCEIGIDPSGGTSYTTIIPEFQMGMSPAITVPGNVEHFFPILIPAGSQVAVRIRGANGTAGTVRVIARFYGFPSNPEHVRVGTFAETYGAVTATSKGTAITPGNAADGSWLDLGAITSELWWWQLGYCIDNGTVTAEYTYFELAWGDGTNFHSIFKVMHGGTTTETCGLAMQTQLLSYAAYQPVPAGNHIYVRARTNNAPDTGYNVTVTGVGG